MNVTVFEAINITKKYRNTLALNQVSMSVMQGDIYGDPMSRKSTN